MSQITTHVLDTSKGKPAVGIVVILYRGEQGLWAEIARSATNNDGRVMDLLPKETLLEIGIYKLRFETKDYFDAAHVSTFYPSIEIDFDLQFSEHYHIPLLVSPFGYSTYRGS